MPELGCGAKCSRCLLAVVNFIVALAGVALLAVSIWFLVDPAVIRFLQVTSDSGTDDLVRGSAAVVLIIGVILIVVGGLGCCGAIMQKRSCLNIFAAILILVVLAEIVAVILAGVFHKQINDEVEQTMRITLRTEYNQTGKNAVTEAWNFMQYELSCCGVKNASDWDSSAYFNKTNELPKTCCKLNSTDWIYPSPKNLTVCQQRKESEFFNNEACLELVDSKVHKYLWILISIVVVVILIEIAAVTMACLLQAKLSSGYETV